MRRLALAALLLVAACSDDDDGGDATTTTTEAVDDTTTTTGADTTTTAAGATTTTTAPEPESDPLEAAQAWLDLAFPGNESTLAEFQQGDTRSGEVPVFRVNEGGGQANLASTLLLRLDDADEWQVIGAVGEFVTIEAPSNGAEIERAPLTVSGVGRGFEAHLGVRAIGVDGAVVAETFTSGGAQAEPLPYAAQLDIGACDCPGEELYVVVNGGSGLEGDTGEFAAVRVVVEV